MVIEIKMSLAGDDLKIMGLLNDYDIDFNYLVTLINDRIKKGAHFNKKFLEYLLNRIVGRDTRTIHNEQNRADRIKNTLNGTIIDVLINLLSYIEPNNASVNLILDGDMDCLVDIMCEKKYIDDSTIDLLFEYNSIRIMEKLINKDIIGEKHLTRIIRYGLYGTAELLLNKKINIGISSLKSAIYVGEFKLVEAIILNSDLKPTINLLQFACLFKCPEGDIQIIEYLLNSGIAPDESCFNAVFMLGSIEKHTFVDPFDNDEEIYAVNFYNSRVSCNQSEKIINLLIKYGYKLSYDNLLEATKHRLTIKDVDEFNFKFDDRFMDLCCKTKFHPNYKIDIAPTLDQLLKLCSYGNLTEIKKMVESGIKPTSSCLEESCKLPMNLHIIKYLIKLLPLHRMWNFLITVSRFLLLLLSGYLPPLRSI